MGRITVTLYTDDLTGERSDNTTKHVFSIDGATYEIDLIPENHQKLLEAMEPFVNAARRTSRSRTARVKQPRGELSEAAKVRRWARNNGIEVNSRGLVRQDIVDLYEAALGR
ncbi:Lsr2 family protein [Streptomyces sp. NPDC005498]|uniref:histone-like nucleoid-structuring protein Lsr2 n=1 Tax=Streptomyces sp. NPDC005498 TaxID=3364717 RepID=UPI0036CBF3B5